AGFRTICSHRGKPRWPQGLTVPRLGCAHRHFSAGTNSPAQRLNSGGTCSDVAPPVQNEQHELCGGTRMSRLPFVFLVLSVSLCSASAQGGHLGTPQEQHACSRDASRFCRKQLGDDTSVQQCLQRNRAKLSTAC